MKYMDKSAYKNLKLQQKDIKWTVYLPVKTGAPETSGNSSLLHHATSLLKKTLVQDGTPKKEVNQIVQSIRSQYKSFEHPINANSVLIVIREDYSSQLYGLPLSLQSGVVSDLQEYMFKPLDEHFSNDKSVYLLEIDQKGCKLFEWDINGLVRLSDSSLEKSLNSALAIDELEQRSVQMHMTSAGGSGRPEGFHGQGGYKDKRKIYLANYLRYIDSKLTNYTHKTIKPIILVGSKQITSAFTKLSHNKKQIKGYLRDLPNNTTRESMNSFL